MPDINELNKRLAAIIRECDILSKEAKEAGNTDVLETLETIRGLATGEY